MTTQMDSSRYSTSNMCDSRLMALIRSQCTNKRLTNISLLQSVQKASVNLQWGIKWSQSISLRDSTKREYKPDRHPVHRVSCRLLSKTLDQTNRTVEDKIPFSFSTSISPSSKPLVDSTCRLTNSRMRISRTNWTK